MKTVYELKGKAKEYCDLTINIYTGCSHGCVYCQAPGVLCKTREQFASMEGQSLTELQKADRELIRQYEEFLSLKVLTGTFNLSDIPFAIRSSCRTYYIYAFRCSRGNDEKYRKYLQILEEHS